MRGLAKYPIARVAPALPNAAQLSLWLETAPRANGARDARGPSSYLHPRSRAVGCHREEELHELGRPPLS
eukprot:1477219-Lingulodinium_polyedra.AAC.1